MARAASTNIVAFLAFERTLKYLRTQTYFWLKKLIFKLFFSLKII